MAIEIFERPIAFTDVETSGLDAVKHEILEIGLVLVNQKTGEIIDTLDIKVKPEHIETANPEALKVNGYSEADWQDAVSLLDAIFCSHNVTFDWSFIAEAFKKAGLKSTLDYHLSRVLVSVRLRLFLVFPKNHYRIAPSMVPTLPTKFL